MPGSESLFHMHALLKSDYAILMYILKVALITDFLVHAKILPL